MDFRFSCQKTSVLGFWCSLRFADFLFFAFVLTLVATPGGRGVLGFSVFQLCFFLNGFPVFVRFWPLLRFADFLFLCICFNTCGVRREFLAESIVALIIYFLLDFICYVVKVKFMM